MKALASVLLQTCLCHVSWHRLMLACQDLVNSLSHACQGLVNSLLPFLNKEPRHWEVNCYVRTTWFITTTKGNTISQGWPCLQRFTCPAWCLVRGTNVRYPVRKRAILLLDQKPLQLPMLETCWALCCNCPPKWCWNSWKHRMLLW